MMASLMVLGIDATQANRRIRSGTEWYAFYLIQQFKKILGGKSDLKIRLYTRGPLQDDLAEDLPENFELKVLKWPLKYFWGQLRLSWEMLINPPDILFCPAHTIPSTSILSRKKRGRIKVFTTLHDVGFRDYPELYDKLSLWYHRFSAWLGIKSVVHILTVSEFSKERIAENYGLQPNKISVTHLGIVKKCSAEYFLTIMKKYKLRECEYFLYIGRLESKKNIFNIVRGFEQFLSLQANSIQSNYNNQILVLAGKKVEIHNVEKYLSTRPNLKSKIQFLDYISEEDKCALYKGAAVFLFPTLYEGFGLPILEAQESGTPVITSNTASNSEVAGDGAILVNPDSPYEISQAINILLQDQNLRQQKIRLGYENVKRFSWEETAKKTWQILSK